MVRNADGSYEDKGRGAKPQGTVNQLMNEIQILKHQNKALKSQLNKSHQLIGSIVKLTKSKKIAELVAQYKSDLLSKS